MKNDKENLVTDISEHMKDCFFEKSFFVEIRTGRMPTSADDIEEGRCVATITFDGRFIKHDNNSPS
jgi:hypothetical protein